jgi:hypothetical protein
VLTVDVPPYTVPKAIGVAADATGIVVHSTPSASAELAVSTCPFVPTVCAV